MSTILLDSSVPRHFVTLDSWRGVCALLVAAFHFPGEGYLSGTSFVQHSRLFVDFFFTLSGFVIAANYLNRVGTPSQAGDFMWLRFGRLYPLHIALFLALFGLEVLKATLQFASAGNIGDTFSEERTLGAAAANVFLVHSLGMFPTDTWNRPSWSISCEMFAYLTFAVLTLLGGRRWRFWLYGAAALGSLVVLALYSDLYFLSVSRFGFFRCIAGFMAGVFAYRLFEMAIRSDLFSRFSQNIWTLIEAAAILLTIAFVSATGFEPASFAAPAVFALVVFIFAFERGRLSDAGKLPGLVYLGGLSYSIYMVHQFVFDRTLGLTHFLERLSGLALTRDGVRGFTVFDAGPLLSDALMIFLLAVIVLVAHFTFSWIEKPFRDMSRRMLQRHKSGKAGKPGGSQERASGTSAIPGA